jgi:hypothetical protein
MMMRFLHQNSLFSSFYTRSDMMEAKNNGLDNAEPRTPESTTPTSFRQWCEEVLKPAVLA